MNFTIAPLLAVLLCGCAAPSAGSATEPPPLATVERVELDRYLGTWFEIASYPQRFQKDCTATTANYSLDDDGDIVVENSCRKFTLDGKLDVARGRARVVDTSTNAKLEVSFFRPFWGDYWIIDLGAQYEYAVVGHPGREYLWVLSRTRTLETAVYDQILARLETQGYDTSRLVVTVQPQ